MSHIPIDFYNWRDFAYCKGKDVNSFYPATISRSYRYNIEGVLTLCRYCPVSEYCLYEAMSYEEVGIWGFTTPVQRHVFLEEYLDNDMSNLTLSSCKKFIRLLKGSDVISPFKKYVQSKKRKYKSIDKYKN